jgi:hypothetical protein
MQRPVQIRTDLSKWGYETVGNVDDSDAGRDRFLTALVNDLV